MRQPTNDLNNGDAWNKYFGMVGASIQLFFEQSIPHYHQSIDQVLPGIQFDPSYHNEQLVFSVL